MESTDLRDVAMLIRERRFDEIGSAAWDAIADKIEGLAPKKRGRPRRRAFLLGGAQGSKIDFNLVGGANTALDRATEISSLYEELLRKGVRKGKAKEIVATNLNLGLKSVESVLTALRKCATVYAQPEE